MPTLDDFVMPAAIYTYVRRLRERAEEREQQRKRRAHGREYAACLATELRAIEQAAKCLPQDDRHWKYHPLALRYRRLVRRWWALPNAAVEGVDTPTQNRLLTRKGTIPKVIRI